MRNKISKNISLKQYRLTDLVTFALILAAADVILYFIPKIFGGSSAIFTLVITVTLLVMIRWGWVSVFYAVGEAVLYCALMRAGWEQYIIFILSNASMILLLIFVKLVGNKKITSNGFLTALLVVAAWFLVCLSRAALGACFGENFLTALGKCCGISETGLLTLAMSLIIILVLRRFDGMVEDQKAYLIRMDKERKERAQADTFGDEPFEPDEESLSILRKRDNDLY